MSKTPRTPTKRLTCDWCERPAADVQPFGEETSACFLCRQEARRHRVFDVKTNRYVKVNES